ncbi:MAG: hypothetical protein GWN61_20930 [candidate division Zixibacteria bacterium]|nr:hypothetical protein [candidate division KSB1 bacterium]NIV08570.1 hypothetical protein [candidate division Zixibacteria bacterium]NIV69038.1 hypothetical protein [Phycisphaerae bacterium]NIT74196.1 hypothetical protein [candidate division KSB1 bacterium]NIW72521.1 hypothetical protein [candidate division KSB1 bacterium]
MAENPVARKLMFEACKDPSSRFRSRVPGQLSFQDCQTTAEMVLLHYAAGDYQALIELGCDEDFRQTVISILSEGMQAEKNSDYHRRQCVFALQQLDAIEDTREFVAEIISTGSAAKKESRQDFDEIKQLNMSPLEKLIHQLERWGILVDGKIIYPKIQIGSITNRITYRDPALQTWAKEERDHRIQASSDARLLKFDYRAMEPTLLLHFLLQRFLISLEDVPPDDIYLAIDGRNREAAKSWLNAVINGGGSRFAKQLNPFQTDLWQAIEELRQELLQTVYIEEAVETIAGTRIDLPKNETNLGGKALNRLIQGSASDVFNHAILSVHEHLIKENLPARIYFLLYDEVWIEVSNEIPGPFTKTIMDLLESVNTDFRLLMPLTICLQD